MQNYLMIIEYFGKNFCGWQRQKNNISIQEQIEFALYKTTKYKIKIICSGRTDKGVNATYQVINFYTKIIKKKNLWITANNNILPKEIKINKILLITKNFNSRYSAIYRRYNYLIYNKSIQSTIWKNNSLIIKKQLNIKNMNKACKYIIGENNFYCFRSKKCTQTNFFRNIQYAKFKKYGGFIIFEIQSNSFLYKMIKKITGLMIKIGLGEKDHLYIKIFLRKDFLKKQTKTVPAKGLYLTEIGYEKNLFIKENFTLTKTLK